MTPAELLEWQVYSTFEPFGSPVEDQRAAQYCSLFFNANTPKDTETPLFFDRDPEETSRLKEIEAKHQRETLPDRISEFFNAKIVKQEG